MTTLALTNGATETFELEIVAWLEEGGALIWMHYRDSQFPLKATCSIKAFHEACALIEERSGAKIRDVTPTAVRIPKGETARSPDGERAAE